MFLPEDIVQTVSRTVACPLCSAQSTITLIEDRDPLRGTEGHEIRFECHAEPHTLPEAEMLKLWAAAGMRTHA